MRGEPPKAKPAAAYARAHASMAGLAIKNLVEEKDDQGAGFPDSRSEKTVKLSPPFSIAWHIAQLLLESMVAFDKVAEATAYTRTETINRKSCSAGAARELGSFRPYGRFI